MATIKKDGGYNALPISYKRGNPIPLDKSAVWYNKAEMEEYAVSNPTAYVGQVLSYVNETDNKVEVYVIANEAGDLELLNLAEIIGAAADDKEGVSATGLYAILDQKVDKGSVYSKNEVDTKIGEIIVEGSHLKREILSEVPSEEKPLSSLIDVDSKDALNTIYMVKTGLEDDSNKYNEYIVIEEEGGNRIIEPVGSWEVDLSGYAKKTDLNTYATKDALVEYLKKGEAELNYVNNVDTTTGLTYDSNSKTLSLDVGSYPSLKKALDDKISVQPGYGLISDADKALLQQFKDGYIADVDTDELAVNNQKLSLSDSLRETIASKATAASVAAFKLEVQSSINTINESIVWVDLKDVK